MSVKTLRNQLLAAIAMTLVAAIALGSSTFAWFAINNVVEVTGMNVNTKVSNNLLISGTPAEQEFTLGYHQTMSKALLEPVSTIKALDNTYYYTSTTNVLGSGDAKQDIYTLYVGGTGSGNTVDAFDMNYGVNTAIAGTVDALPYIDYNFYLKATNADSDARQIYFTKVNLLYDGVPLINSGKPDRAWRVAIFAKGYNALSDAAAETGLIADENRKTILAPASAAYFTTNCGVSAPNAEPSVAVNNLSSPAVIDASLATLATKYYKVTVRLWLEGEDNTCNNDTYAQLTRDWGLDLEIRLGQNSDSLGDNSVAVTTIGSTVNAVTTNATTAAVSLGANNALANGEKAATFAWVNLDGSAISGTTDESTYTAPVTPGTYYVYCNITTDKGNVYRTNTVVLTVS